MEMEIADEQRGCRDLLGKSWGKVRVRRNARPRNVGSNAEWGNSSLPASSQVSGSVMLKVVFNLCPDAFLLLHTSTCTLHSRARYHVVVIGRDQRCAPTAPHISLKSPSPLCRTFPTANRCRMNDPSHAASRIPYRRHGPGDCRPYCPASCASSIKHRAAKSGRDPVARHQMTVIFGS